MKPEEIKTALERYVICYGKDIFIADNIRVADILDLINQYEAENTKLLGKIVKLEEECEWLQDTLETTKAEAIKEFAERLLKKELESEYFSHIAFQALNFDTNNLLKEMGVE